MRNSKNRYFYHIFVSRGDAPGVITITLNVVWMERELDAYKLSRCMCPSNYNRFWDRARYLWKNRHFIIPLAFDAPVRGFPSEYRHPLWYGKTRMVSLPEGEKISKIRLFVLTWSTNVTDGQTDRGTDAAWQQRPRLCIASRGKNVALWVMAAKIARNCNFWYKFAPKKKSRGFIEKLEYRCTTKNLPLCNGTVIVMKITLLHSVSVITNFVIPKRDKQTVWQTDRQKKNITLFRLQPARDPRSPPYLTRWW